MTATFKEFKIDSSTTGASGTWDEQNAVTNTAVCSPDSSIIIIQDNHFFLFFLTGLSCEHARHRHRSQVNIYSYCSIAIVKFILVVSKLHCFPSSVSLCVSFTSRRERQMFFFLLKHAAYDLF